MSILDLQIAVLQTSSSAVEFGVNWFIQSTLLILVGITIGYFLRRHGSAVQSAIYRTTLISVLICPLATLALSVFGISGWSVQLPSGYSYERRADPSDEIATSMLPIPQSPINTPKVERSDSGEIDLPMVVDRQSTAALDPTITNALQQETSPPLHVPDPVITNGPQAIAEMWDFTIAPLGLLAVGLFTIWMLVSSVLLGRLAVAWRSLARLRRSAERVEPEIFAECQRIACEMQVVVPEVLRTPFLPSPCLAGIRRPAVLLPEQAASISLRDVLVHELAHLRRHDCDWNLLRRLSTALLCFQPLLWWLSRMIESSAEEVCDDYVVSFGGDRTEYAKRLVDVAELSSIPAAPAGVGIVAVRSMLARRVQRIMDTSRTLSTRIGNLLLALVLISGLVGTAAVGFVGLESNAQPTANDGGLQDDRSTNFDEQERERVEFSGTVVGPDGKPMGGARIEVTTMTYFSAKLEKVSLAETIADADGHFQASYLKSAVPDTDRPQDARKPVCVVASMSGHAPSWIYIPNEPLDDPLKLRLANDNMPIRGRILDLEGNPVSGIEVSIDKVSVPTDPNLDSWLAAIGQGELMPEANHRHLSSLIRPSIAYPVTNAKTDSNGVFRFSGIGSDRVVEVSLQGESIAYTTATIVTRKMDSMIALGGYHRVPGMSYKTTVYGGECRITVEPTQPIVGVVRDAETGQPMAGVRIESYRVGNQTEFAWGQVHVTSDQQGRFRLVGLPKSTGRQVMADPNDDQPYLMRRYDVPDRPGLDPIEMDLELHRGIWITGKISDKQSGKPVGGEAAARMYYFPYRDNPYAAALPEYQGFDAHGHQHRYPVNADGSYRMVGLPGTAIVGIAVFNKAYPSGMGSADIEEVNDRSHALTFAAPGTTSPTDRWPTAMKKINVAEGTDEIQVDFQLDSGRSIQLTVLDDQGAEIEGVKVCGARYRTFWYTMDSPTFDAVALADSEERTMLFHHPERKLGKAIQVKVNNRTPDSMTVKLEPCVTIRGQLVDSNELPIAAATIAILPRPGGHDSPSLEEVKTDANGRFSHDGVLPGTQYDIVSESLEVGSKVLARELTVHSGETIDLGTIDATSDERPEPMRSSVAAAEQPTTSNQPNEKSQSITFAGTVVDPAGKPIADADVRFTMRMGDAEQDLRVRDTTDRNGRFQFQVTKEEVDRRNENFLPPFDAPVIVASRDGYGPVAVLATEVEDFSEVKLMLPADDIPVQGQIVDLEGNPVRDATLKVLYFEQAQDGNLSEWIQSLNDYGEFKLLIEFG